MFIGTPNQTLASLQSQVTTAQTSANSKVTKVDLLSDLKALTPIVGAKVYLTGKTNIGDNLGGLYTWDTASTAAEDTVFMNIIPANEVSTGRWLRVFQKAIQYPAGTMILNGGKKEYFCQATTDANGDATVYLTDTGLSTGNALFSEIWFHDARANSTATTPTTAVSSFFKSLTSLKTLVYGQFKANPVTITLGLVYAPSAAVGAGTSVLFKIEGI